MLKNQFLKVKNSLLVLEKDFIELNNRELKDRKVKIEREIEKLFLYPILVFIDDMDKFEQKEMNKISPIKNIWYDWLINYIPEPIRESLGNFKEKIVSLFKPKTPKQTVYATEKKLSKPKAQNRNPFILKRKKEIEDIRQ